MSANLTRTAITALGWSYIGTALRILVQLGAGIVLARILGPYAFGLVATSWALVGAGSQFVDFGFSSALIQQSDVSEEDIRFVFTVQTAIGVALAAAFLLSAGFLAAILGDPELAPAIRVLSLALVAQALGQTAIALLKRRLDFKATQVAQLAGVVFGYLAVALPLAIFTRYSVLSLALGQLSQIAITTALAYAAVRHPWRPRFIPTNALVGFGFRATATNLVNWLIASLDSLAMSRAFGIGATGYYNRAQNLALTPTGNLVQVLQSVLFPAYARRTGDPEATRRAYLASLSAAALFILPVTAMLAVAAETVTTGLYGPTWASAAPLLLPLAIAMPFHAAMSLSGPLLWAHNRVGVEFRVQFAALALFAVLLAVAMRYAPQAIASSVCAVYVARALPIAASAFRATGATFTDAWRVLSGPLAVAVIAGCAAAGTDLYFAAMPPTQRLLAVGGAVVAASLATTAVAFRTVLPVELLTLFETYAFHRRAAAASGDIA